MNINNSKLELSANSRFEITFNESINVERVYNILINKFKDKDFLFKFNQHGFIKLSRSEFKILDSSMIIEKNKKGEDFAFNGYKFPDIKIYGMIHGKRGIVGQGSLKMCRVIVNLDNSEDKKVLSKFKNYDWDHVQTSLYGMVEALKKVEDKPHVNGGFLIALKCFKFKTKKEYAIIINEFGETDLFKYIYKQKDHSLNSKLKFTRELLEGLVEMHENGVAHMDIKPKNVFIVKGVAKLSDLDLATSVGKLVEGTPTHLAPELLGRAVASIQEFMKADVYSLGVTLFELYNNKHPWYNSKIKENPLRERAKPQNINTIEHLIWEMMQKNPEKRPTAREALDRFNSL